MRSVTLSSVTGADGKFGFATGGGAEDVSADWADH